MSGMTPKRGANSKRNPVPSSGGRGGKKATKAKTDHGGRPRAMSKPKKSTRLRMTREDDESFRAIASRRPGGSTTRKSATFALDAPEVQQVSIAGSFNNWEPQVMSKDRGDTWRITIQLLPGTYEYKFLVDGEWRDDANNPRKRPNEFGGYNSICEVL